MKNTCNFFAHKGKKEKGFHTYTFILFTNSGQRIKKDWLIPIQQMKHFENENLKRASKKEGAGRQRWFVNILHSYLSNVISLAVLTLSFKHK